MGINDLNRRIGVLQKRLQEVEAANVHLKGQIDELSQFILKEFVNEIGANGVNEGACELAVRLLKRLKLAVVR